MTRESNFRMADEEGVSAGVNPGLALVKKTRPDDTNDELVL